MIALLKTLKVLNIINTFLSKSCWHLQNVFCNSSKNIFTSLQQVHHNIKHDFALTTYILIHPSIMCRLFQSQVVGRQQFEQGGRNISFHSFLQILWKAPWCSQARQDKLLCVFNLSWVVLSTYGCARNNTPYWEGGILTRCLKHINRFLSIWSLFWITELLNPSLKESPAIMQRKLMFYQLLCFILSVTF